MLYPSNPAEDSAEVLTFQTSRKQPYIVNFARNNIRFSVESSYLGQAYQKYQPNAPTYVNPSLSGLMRIELSDAPEEYRFKGAIRIPTTRNAHELFLALDLLEKRWDKTLRYYRRTFEETVEEGLNKSVVHNLAIDWIYPINPALSLNLTLNNRLDVSRPTYLEISDFTRPNSYTYSAGAISNLVFDNAIQYSANSWSGSRMKLFAEYMQVPDQNGGMFNIGFDLRHSISLLREFVWVNRFSGSTSLGKQRLLYF